MDPGRVKYIGPGGDGIGERRKVAWDEPIQNVDILSADHNNDSNDKDDEGTDSNCNAGESERGGKSTWSETDDGVENHTAQLSASHYLGGGQNARDTWTHLRHATISQDQTQAGASEREKLAALQQEPCDADGAAKEKPRRSTMPRFQGTPARNHMTLGNTVHLAHGSYMDESVTPSTMLTMTSSNGPTGVKTQSNAVKIAQLEEEIQELRRLQSSLKSTTWHVFHKIEGDESSYLDEPSWTWDQKLKGNSPLADPVVYLHQRLDVAFVVYKHYEHDYQTQTIAKAKNEGSMLPDPVPAKETIRLLSEQMISAMDAFVDAQPRFKDWYPDWQSRKPIHSPFLFWYHYRSTGCLDTIPKRHRSQMQLLTEWIEKNYAGIYAESEAEFTRGRVSMSTMPFFVRPGEVLVLKSDQGIQGYIAKSWAVHDGSALPSRQDKPQKESPQKTSQTWLVKAWYYQYDGRFYRHNTSLIIRLELDQSHESIDMTKLRVSPLRFANPKFRAQLDHRGRTMWQCRHKKLITYKDEAANDLSEEGERYMIDFNTYKTLHSDSPKLMEAYPFLNKPHRDEIDPAAMESEDPPHHPELLVFPNKLVGYNLREKKWRDLQVDLVQEVSWNKRAFEHLVINHDTKDLIQALVTSKIETKESTDIIQGKGNGLIILLHGGPGTGKTFTAESVAEIAEKPLYRVTCGDIGTQPEQVEKYLESVLHLGKIWGCVVLLDEADVFLEQRTLTNLERNALVSVFLRVLEYYEGILILTSNRVGTFDEAFKSRIQLSLHYETLDKLQRRTIWSNFLSRLKTLESNNTKIEPVEERKRKFEETKGVNFDDIERHLGDLAEHEMNGRQIRNAITTARQLAKFKGDSMAYHHLAHVIKTSMKFDRYLERVRDNCTDDQFAREERLR